MSSSTSSSDKAPPGQRRIFLRILLAILLGMALVLVIFRIFAELNDARAESILGRVMEARAALPEIIALEEDLVMFFGSSMVQAGFSPRVFDRELAGRGVRVKSFNFGFGGLNPYFQDYLSRRIAEAFEERDRRLRLVMIEFNPFQATTTRWQGASEAVDSFLTMLAADRELFDIFLDDPRRGVRLFTIRYLRNDISAEMTTWFLGRGLQPSPQGTDLEENRAAAERLGELNDILNQRFEEDYPDWDGSDWNWRWQGGGTIPAERSADTRRLMVEFHELLRTDYRMDNDRLFRIRTADIIDLRFEELLVESFIRIVQNFQRIADRVEIVMLPKNTEWIVNPPEALARQAAVVARIERETGLRIRDYQYTHEISPDMYSDTTHLGRYIGDVPFTLLLARDLYEVLAAGPP